MRLIDADALIDKFKNKDANGISLVLDRYAIKCIVSAPTIEPEQHWIPCSERLPEEPNCYLVTWDEGYLNADDEPFYVCEVMAFDDGEWDELGDKIEAWMPLPQPYKEPVHATDDHER